MDEPPWYEQAFRADYRRVYAHRDVESARPEARFLVESGVGGRTLDLCCGFGRHALLLSERGVDVVGLDLSMELLLEARTLSGFDRHLAGRLARGDMASLPFQGGSFDSVVNLFSSFGYLGDEGDARAVREIARVLRPGGLVVLDLMNPENVRATLEPLSARSGEGFQVTERRRLEDGGRRVEKEVELRLESGEVRRWREDVRLYGAGELRGLLESGGLRIDAVHGGFDRRAPSADAPRRIVLARRI